MQEQIMLSRAGTISALRFNVAETPHFLAGPQGQCRFSC